MTDGSGRLISTQAFLAVAFLVCVVWGLPSRADTKDYRLGASDLMRVNVFDHPELSIDARISESGKITFPLLGEIAVVGSSPRDVEQLLTHRLEEGGFVRQAQVLVLVTDYQSQKIAVIGQVLKPGQYALATANKVLDLLAQAGGLVNGPTGVAGAAGDEAALIRRDGSKVQIDLLALFSGDPRQNLPVAAGDTIFVPRAAQFYVYGEVQRPGIYRLEHNMTISRAISASGGLTPRGSEHRMLVKRPDAAGKERKISVQGPDPLQPEDILLIKQSLF
jgi:polysaccharide export outer membrane protein